MVSICIQMTGMCVLVFLKPIISKIGSNLSQEDYNIDYSCINLKVTSFLCEMQLVISYKAMPFDQTPQRAHSVHVGHGRKV